MICIPTGAILLPSKNSKCFFKLGSDGLSRVVNKEPLSPHPCQVSDPWLYKPLPCPLCLEGLQGQNFPESCRSWTFHPLPQNLAVMLFGDLRVNYRGLRGTEEGKLPISRCSEVTSLFRIACHSGCRSHSYTDFRLRKGYP